MTPAELVGSRRLLVCAGAGGVGRTTIAAALALAAARAGRRARVVTVDDGADLRPTWDRLVRDQAPTPEAAGRLLSEPFYHSLSRSFAGTRAYLAAWEIGTADAHDLVIVDAPAGARGFDLLEAPARIGGLLDERVLRWLLAPYRPGAGVAGVAGRYAAVARLAVARLEGAAGASALVDVSAFFAALAPLLAPLRARAAELAALLAGPDAGVVLVAGGGAAAVAAARIRAARLGALGLAPAATIVNRAHAGGADADGPAVRAALADAGVAAPLGDWLAARHAEAQRAGRAEAERIQALGAVTVVPEVEGGVEEIAGILAGS